MDSVWTVLEAYPMAVALVVGVLVVAGCIAAPCVLMAFLRELAGGDDLLR